MKSRALMPVICLSFVVLFGLIVAIHYIGKSREPEPEMVWCNKQGRMVPRSDCPCRQSA